MDYNTEIWRPWSNDGPICRFTFDDVMCEESGDHHCAPRAEKFIRFCSDLLRHTAGPKARTPFVLEDWQEHEIAHPIFGEVTWSDEWEQYVRRHRVALVVISRKNGKSALAAAVVLYLIVGDGEESAEIYGAAVDRGQAAKVYQPVQRMMTLSPVLRARLKENKAAKRISDEASNSYYEIIAADALGELGHNPHGFILDEVLSQPNRDLWDALRTAAGARSQALFLAITTETNDSASFGASLIDEAERIQDNPSLSAHTFAWIRKTPKSYDPWNEKNWYYANPALGSFKALSEMRTLASEAKNDPSKENSFRQFQLNQRVQQETRWMPMDRWHKSHLSPFTEESLYGFSCFSGLDLASTTDLACLAHLFYCEEEEIYRVVWRFWTPEAMMDKFDKYTSGEATQWAREGYLRVTQGDWIDYYGDDKGFSPNEIHGVPDSLAIHPQIELDSNLFDIKLLGYDRAQATATAQYLDNNVELKIKPITQGFGLSSGLQEIMRLTKSQELDHGDHPVANWCFDSVDVKRDVQDRIQVVKPERASSHKRIDGVVALADCIRARDEHEPEDEEEVDLLSSIW